MAKQGQEADPRRVAWEVLIAVENGAFADAALGRRLPKARLEPRDRALATRLVYGTLAWQGYLDYLIAAFARPARQLDPPVRSLLRMGLFQITQLNRVPDFAAVNTSVELAKTFRGGAANGLVNAVLRRCLRERETVALPPAAADLVGSLAVTRSHPRWLVQLWLEELGRAEAEDLLCANNEPAPTVLRVNGRRARRAQVLESLAEAGVAGHPTPFAGDGIVLEDGTEPSALPGHAAGLFSVQGEASQLVASLLGARPGDRVLDACAAPGGKAAHIGEMCDDRGCVVAVDVSAHGLTRLSREARRLGLASIRTVVGDARDHALLADEVFDAVLLDAPCSGLGTLRQHPEIKWRRTPRGLREAARLQSELLRSNAARVRPGGALVYATCTITRIENERVVSRFLAEHPAFAVEDPAPLLPPAARNLVDENRFLRTFPHRHALDGFFAVRLKRQG